MITTNKLRQEKFDRMKEEYDRTKEKEKQQMELNTSRRNQVGLSAWTDVMSGIVSTVVEVMDGVSDRIGTLTNLVEKVLQKKRKRKRKGKGKGNGSFGK